MDRILHHLKFLEAGALSPELISTSEQKKDYEYYGLASENAEKKVDDLKQNLIQYYVNNKQ